MAREAREADNTGTIATEDRFESLRRIQREKEERRQAAAAAAAAAEEEAKLLNSASASACPSASLHSETASTIGNPTDANDDEDEDDDDEGGEEVQIDEDLFADDLDDIEEQLRETNMTS